MTADRKVTPTGFGPRNAEEAEVFAVEHFIADTQFRLHQLLEVKGVSRSELAAKLGVPKSRVTAMFGSHSNLTLQTIGRILFALGENGVLSSPTIDRRMAELEGGAGANPRRRFAEEPYREVSEEMRTPVVTRAPGCSVANVMRVLKNRDDARSLRVCNHNSEAAGAVGQASPKAA
jgi:hypothetical protein